MKVREITIPPFNASAGYFTLTNEDGVEYKCNDLDTLIRYFVGHTQQKAVRVGSVGLPINGITD